jgi:hypothetical protein
MHRDYPFGPLTVRRQAHALGRLDLFRCRTLKRGHQTLDHNPPVGFHHPVIVDGDTVSEASLAEPDRQLDVAKPEVVLNTDHGAATEF